MTRTGQYIICLRYTILFLFTGFTFIKCASFDISYVASWYKKCVKDFNDLCSLLLTVFFFNTHGMPMESVQNIRESFTQRSIISGRPLHCISYFSANYRLSTRSFTITWSNVLSWLYSLQTFRKHVKLINSIGY